MLADSLIAKLNMRIIYEKISINTKKGSIKRGHVGIKRKKMLKPCDWKPIKKIVDPNQRDKNNMPSTWLVKAMPKGKRLNKLSPKMEKKM